MTDTLTEIVARAIMVSDVCGLTLEGERAFCDDPRAGKDCQKTCDCKLSAQAALKAIQDAGYAFVPVDRANDLLAAVAAEWGQGSQEHNIARDFAALQATQKEE